MEYFERAHVAKTDELMKKDIKSEETIKKQLKQMLYGYKNSDNEIIKSSIDIKVNTGDSSSVSDFSDLNLTVSSGADDTTRATIGSPDDIDSILDDSITEISPKFTDLSLDNNSEKQSDSISVEISSKSEDIRRETYENSSSKSGEEDEELSFTSYSINSFTDTESTQEFDPDGMLAAKIHEKLKTKQVPKRKIEKDEINCEDVDFDMFSSKSKKNRLPFQPHILHPRLLEKESNTLDTSFNKSSPQNSIDESYMNSPTHITINASKIQQEKFSDVLGEYNYSVIKNIPYDNNELMFTELTSRFCTSTEVTVDEDIDEKIINLSDTDLHTEYTSDKVDNQSLQLENIDLSQNVTLDSTENVDEPLQSEVPVSFTKKRFEDSINLLFKGNICVCIMKHPSKLYVNGKFKVQSFGGKVQVFGHTLTERNAEIFAPYCNFAYCLSTVEKQDTFYGLFGKLTKSGLTVTDAENIVTTIGEYDAVLVIKPLKSAKMTFVESNFSAANLFSKSGKHVDHCHVKALERLECSIYMSQPRKYFEVPISWQEIDKYCFKEQSRGILCGGKGVGKSTCLRYNVNRLLQRGPVLVIDLDIGQSEFTVAGNISATVVKKPLLGPNFTHLRKPVRTLNLGMINALDNMERYVNAVVSLIAHCASDERLREMRWIVNTMGLCNVIGLHFITITILHCQPTYLLQIDSKNVKKRYEMFLRPQLVATHYADHKSMKLFANTSCPDNFNYGFVLSHHTENPVNHNFLAPRDERYLNFLAYFGEVLQIYRDSTLLGIAPYEVQLQDLCVYMNVKIPKGTVQQVLNGKIVALCQHAPGSVTNKTYVLAKEPLLCRGHGLIRGIDFEKGILFVITPLSIEDLQVVDTLLYADWVPELRGQEAHLPAGTAVPYRMPTMYQQKQFMFTPRRRFNPVQLLKMSRGA